MNILLAILKHYNIYIEKRFENMKKFLPLKSSEKAVISVRLDDDRLKELDRIANQISISRNQLINQCIDFAIKNLNFKEIELQVKNQNNK